MTEQDRLQFRLKAEAFDRLVEKYRSLEDDDGFYSRHWLEFSELLEQEVRQIQWVLKDRSDDG